MKPNAYNTIPIPAVHVMDLIAEGKMKSDENRIIPVSTLLEGEYGEKNVYAGVPDCT